MQRRRKARGLHGRAEIQGVMRHKIDGFGGGRAVVFGVLREARGFGSNAEPVGSFRRHNTRVVGGHCAFEEFAHLLAQVVPAPLGGAVQLFGNLELDPRARTPLRFHREPERPRAIVGAQARLISRVARLREHFVHSLRRGTRHEGLPNSSLSSGHATLHTVVEGLPKTRHICGLFGVWYLRVGRLPVLPIMLGMPRFTAQLRKAPCRRNSTMTNLRCACRRCNTIFLAVLTPREIAVPPRCRILDGDDDEGLPRIFRLQHSPGLDPLHPPAGSDQLRPTSQDRRSARRPSRSYRPDGCSVGAAGVPLAAGAGLAVLLEAGAGVELLAAGAAPGLLAGGGGLELLANGL